MSHRPAVWIGLALATVSILVVGLWMINNGSGSATDTTAAMFPVNRHVHWELNVRNRTDQALQDVEIYSFLPLSDTWQQSLVGVKASHPMETELDAQDRAVGLVRVESIPPFGQRSVRFEAELALANGHRNPERTDVERWLEPEALIESDHQAVVQLAGQLGIADTTRIARRIYDWLVAEVTYSGYDPIDRGALHALMERAGDCSEFSALAVALARAAGLPARLVNGFVMSDSGRLSPYGLHAWAEIRLDDRWLILDAQKRQFDPPPEHYLVTHYGTTQSRAETWTRFHSTEAAVEIEMR